MRFPGKERKLELAIGLILMGAVLLSLSPILAGDRLGDFFSRLASRRTAVASNPAVTPASTTPEPLITSVTQVSASDSLRLSGLSNDTSATLFTTQSLASSADLNTTATQSSATMRFTVRLVWNGGGAPVRGGTISCRADSGNTTSPAARGQWKTATSNARGEAVFTLPSAPNVWVAGEAPGATRVERLIVLPARQPVVINLDRGLMAFGTVYKEEGGKKVPVAGAEVSARYDRAPRAVSGPDGRYRLTGISRGDIELFASLGDLRWPSSREEYHVFHLDPKAPNGPFDIVLKPGVALTGAVIDKSTLKPVPGAAVTLLADIKRRSNCDFDFTDLDQTLKTDSQGLFAFRSLPEGNHRLRVMAQGYGELMRPVTLDRGKENTVMLELAGGGCIDVRITDLDGQPVAGAHPDYTRPGGMIVDYSLLTDDDGRLTIEGVTWGIPYNVFAWIHDYSSDSKSVTLQPGQERAQVDLTMNFHVKDMNDPEKSLGVIVGRVTDERGKPLPGVNILCQPWWAAIRDQTGVTAVTNAMGEYRVEFLGPGEALGKYFVAASLDGYGPGWADQVPFGTPSRPNRIDFKLKPAHWLSGVVTDETGAPIPDVLVEPLPVDAGLYSQIGHPAMGVRSTGPDGSFMLRNLSGPQVELNLVKSGYVMDGVTPSIGPAGNPRFDVDRNVTIRLRRTAELRGQVFDRSTGAPVSRFSVSILGLNIGRNFSMGDQAFSASDGSFRIDGLTSGQPGLVRITAPGYQVLLVDINTPNGIAEPMRFELTPLPTPAPQGSNP